MSEVVGTPVEPVDLNTLTFGQLKEKGSLCLPGGFIDNEGALHKDVSLKEMTGEEEDILLSTGTSGHEKINRVITNCVASVGPYTDRKTIEAAVRRMVVGDRVVLLLGLRIMSLGEEYNFGTTCDSCGAKNNHSVDLLGLEVKPSPDPEKREQTVKLPSGKSAVLKVMTGEDEARIAKAAGKGKKKKGRDVMTLNIVARLKELDGSPAGALAAKRLSMRDRSFIRSWYINNEGGVDTDLQLDCVSCGQEFDSVLDAGQPDFFFPRDTE